MPGEPADAQEVIAALAEPRRLRPWNDIISRPSPVSDAPGAYAWYFRAPPPAVPLDDCIQYEGGTAPYAGRGFVAIALATTLIPLGALLLVLPLRSVPPTPQARPAFTKVVGAVWLPGLGLALSSVGFGAITTFIVLLFAQHGWGQGWLALTVLSIAFTAGRMVFGHLPDRIGGARVALVCVLIEAAGQALIWLAPWSALALVGAALTGLGYSLVYPGFGVEAVRRAPPQSRGLAMGAYTACLDLALGLASPALGLIASEAGLGAVFLASTLVVLCAAAVAMRLLYALSHAISFIHELKR